MTQVSTALEAERINSMSGRLYTEAGVAEDCGNNRR